MAGGGGNKKRFQYCTDPSGQEILYLRALQGHSGRNPVDPINRIGCAVSLHSITNSGLIAGGQNSSKTDGILYSRESHEKGSQGSAGA